MVYELRQADRAASLFEGWQETMVWSCLKGVMGTAYADSQTRPLSAAVVLGDFCFLAGAPSEEMLSHLSAMRTFLILVPRDAGWSERIAAFLHGRVKKVARYATKKEPDAFDKTALKAAVDGLPAGYDLKMVDEALFFRCRETQWCRDFVAQYDSYAAYQKHGMGALILKDGELVSGASSYSGYPGGIEIEVDTREGCRRQGLARVCAAKLILECQKRGWYPSWDAQNKGSLALAEKLGYHFDYEYEAYELMQEDRQKDALFAG